MDEEQENRGLIIEFGQVFLDRFNNYPIVDIEKIKEFTDHITLYGFEGLAGRNKRSDNVDTNDHEFIEKVKHAQKYNLYHYHIGIPEYDKTNGHGEWTSQYILHYKYLDNVVTIVDLDQHPPFTLPDEEYLK